VLPFYFTLQIPDSHRQSNDGRSASNADPWSYAALLRATRRIPLAFYNRPTIEVAKSLLGCVLFHNQSAGMIVEVEAYLGLRDTAAHASRGVTDRTRAIFGPPGRAYVYFSYGMHECLNVVAEPDGTAGCVLLRALEPLTGLADMQERRSWHGKPCMLANGPGKLTQALAITRAHYGARLDKGELHLRQWKSSPDFEIEISPRIGITKNSEAPLRFTWKGHYCLSRR
jgi:DNA-3-methyladenine glycosylase